MTDAMFCFQCQEAAKGTGCTIKGVCGKDSELAALQDILLYMVKGVATLHLTARQNGLICEEAEMYIMNSLFATITNANFNKTVFYNRIREGLTWKTHIRQQLEEMGVDLNLSSLQHDAVTWYPRTDEDIASKWIKASVLATEQEDIRSLKELLTYGVKGMAAYAEHAAQLGYRDPEVHAFIDRALAATLEDQIAVDEWLSLIMTCGKYGVQVMSLLDQANTSTFGHPEITKVNIGVRQRPAILVSGHDLKDLEELLKQTEGTGIDVYTHSEMLPAHYYPAFKKYEHFVGNYGNAWWKQETELEMFNGPILFTTNCIVPTKKPYVNRMYTTGQAGYPGAVHIEERKAGEPKDFSMIIEHARRCEPPVQIEEGEIVGGFAHHTVLGLADQVLEAVQSGQIRKFFVMAGCDGRMKSREYYSDFAEQLPEDTVILTAGCAKYKYNKLPLGDIGGIPRILDAGQCNDSYSLAVIALKLKEALGLEDINELPISYNIAWYEQKAVIVLLALLHLGVKDIHLGPTLPAFLSPNVAKVLVEQFGIAGITTVEADMAAFLSHAEQ
ncbi:hydroxylamine reductase [Marinicrinis sediminis]|uniref:Hydroxylamine reductase n=1 Tax=Marinicrinis sediminis TaxID=1652465 RepID=A0ABW5RE04_9BACL